MKHLLFLIILGLSSWSFSQAPEGINYQMVVRNFSNTLITNSPMAIRIQIRQTSAIGTIVYSERHPVTTSAQGLVNLVIGGGTVLSGTFSTISWANGPYFACFAIDFSGLSGTNYQDYGSQQLVSVPYALYAKSSGAILNQWQYGTGVPASSSGVTGNYYYDTANGNIYYKQNGTTWILAGNIMGPTGATGQQGTTGATGAQGPQGIQGPAGATGAAGPQGIQGVTGPQGPIGLTGPQGPAGPNGSNGTAVLNGTTPPTTVIGVNGDFYINTATNILYGPKAGGTWPAGTSLVGPTGPIGTSGATGPQGPIGLTGATGFISSGSASGNTPYWNGTQWVLNSSNIYNNGGNVGIGTSNPTVKLEINGRIKSMGINELSDSRYKNNIVTLTNALENIEKLRGVTYDWRQNEFPNKNFDQRHQIGLIAQEVELIYPELVYTDTDGFKSVDYNKLVAVLIEGIKELQIEMQSLETKLMEQNTSIQNLQTSVNELYNLIGLKTSKNK